MFIDASAIAAILNCEAGYADLVRRIGDHEGQPFTSPMAQFEASVSLARARSGAQAKPSRALVEVCAALVSEFVEELSARDIHITGSIGDGAIQAAAEYGMGLRTARRERGGYAACRFAREQIRHKSAMTLVPAQARVRTHKPA